MFDRYGRDARKALRREKQSVNEARGSSRARGGERLSESQKGDSSDAAGRKGASGERPADPKNRKQRSGDVGRALRSVYDDTLRESVPDDFLDLLGKLS